MPIKKNRISVVIIFHNMEREAKRTLYSLSAKYQKDISVDDYEVIAVDSSSTTMLDVSFVNSCGPNFRYLKVDWQYPSPCRAINYGVAAARYEIVMCVIDGARILSPGILKKSQECFDKFDNPFVYTLGMHLGPKVQNMSVLEGYCQAVEDQLLKTVDWETDGYSLFSISSLALSSKDGYYSQLSESNCFAIYKNTYSEVGGYDERFVTRGGGLCNLDIFNRVLERDDVNPVVLLGEATFHQYHGGVATNVPLNEHPWEEFAQEYREIYNKEYSTVIRTPKYYGVDNITFK